MPTFAGNTFCKIKFESPQNRSPSEGVLGPKLHEFLTALHCHLHFWPRNGKWPRIQRSAESLFPFTMSHSTEPCPSWHDAQIHSGASAKAAVAVTNRCNRLGVLFQGTSKFQRQCLLLTFTNAKTVTPL